MIYKTGNVGDVSQTFFNTMKAHTMKSQTEIDEKINARTAQKMRSFDRQFSGFNKFI